MGAHVPIFYIKGEKMDIRKLPRTEFALSIAQLAGERSIDPQDILNLIEQGIISAFKRDQREKDIIVDEEAVFEVELSPESGSFEIFEVEGEKRTKVTPPGFGRIAAQTAMNVLKQGLNDLQSEKAISEYRSKIGTLISGVVIRADQYRATISLDRELEAVVPKDELVPSDELRSGDRKLFLLKDIQTDETGRNTIILSRRDQNFIKQLFAREVPEVQNSIVIIERVARTPGERTKVAVSSSQAGVDPVGSCIGQKGSRIQSILGELPQNEKLDVIQFSSNQEQFIAQALSPAENLKVLSVEGSFAKVAVPEDQLALAIGSGGENVRLAGILTGLDIKVGTEADFAKAKK